MTAAIYSRVSTSSQDHSLQVSELMQYCSRMGWDVVQYADTASGSNAPRADLQRLLKDCRERRVDVVVVWKLDRFGRSLSDLLNLLEHLKWSCVRFIALRDQIDTDSKSPFGKLQIHLFGAVAEFEKSLIQERSRAGVAEARKHGKRFGRPTKVFDRLQVQEMRNKGMCWRDIAEAIHVPYSTVRGQMQRQKER
jgi:putative DNA-invertase from lambdoid prophage Rac